MHALAQDNHLDVYRLLVQAGRDGLPAGQVATALGLAPNTLTFHFDRLRAAGLVSVRRDGRSMIYAARYDTMEALLGYLTENCCKGAPTPSAHREWYAAPVWQGAEFECASGKPPQQLSASINAQGLAAPRRLD